MSGTLTTTITDSGATWKGNSLSVMKAAVTLNYSQAGRPQTIVRARLHSKVPLNESGTPDTRYTSVTLSALDPTYSDRALKATSMQLADARVPYRCQITKYQ